MVKQTDFSTAHIPEALAQARWEQALSLYETWTEIWLSNPLLAHQAGRRVEELISTLSEVQRRRAQDLR
jgi:hypothetical protein